RHPDEQPKSLGNANVIIFGMGRTGTAAYLELEQAGHQPVGLDADAYALEAHLKAGRHAIFADAEDSSFWNAVSLSGITAAILAMDDLEAKLIAARMLREKGFDGPIVSHALYAEHAETIRAAGADQTYLTMQEAGRSLAGHAIEALS
ncbi:MAG: NAD(P)-binding protein, partial [Pseudomonadota bacterium]